MLPHCQSELFESNVSFFASFQKCSLSITPKSECLKSKVDPLFDVVKDEISLIYPLVGQPAFGSFFLSSGSPGGLPFIQVVTDEAAAQALIEPLSPELGLVNSATNAFITQTEVHWTKTLRICESQCALL
jgi:hypothetical protein